MIKIFYGWWIVAACFVINLYVSSIIFFGFTAFFEPLVREFGWSYTQVSFASSLRGLEMGIFAPFIGFLVDRFGSKKLIVLGVIIIGAGLLLLSLTSSLIMFYGAILLLGLGGGACTSVVTMSVVANWFEKSVGKAFGVMASGYGASGVFVPVIVWLIEVYHWRAALVLLGVGMWLIGIPLSLVIRNRPEEYGYAPDGKVSGEGVPASEVPPSPPPLSLREILRNRAFLYLNAAEAIRMTAVTAVTTHVMPYLTSIGIPRTTAGWVAAAIPLFSIIGRIGFGSLGDIFSKRYVMALAFGFMVAGLIVFGYVRLGWVLLLFLLLFPPSFGGTMVVRGAFLREYFGRESFGKMLGIVMGSASFGGIIGPTLAGWAFDSTGSYQSIWLAFAALGALAILLVMKMKR